MKSIAIISFLLLIGSNGFGQESNCEQYKKVIEYFKSDTSFNSYYNKVKLKFSINEEVGKGGITPFLTYDYIAIKLGFKDKSLLFAQDTSVFMPEVRQLEKESLTDTTKNTLNCLNNLSVNRNPKIHINFYRKEKNVLSVYTSRIYKKPRHTYGMMHLFFFNELNEIEHIFETTWIE